MIGFDVLVRRPSIVLSAALSILVLAAATVSPPSVVASTDAQLSATLELPEGDIDFPLEAGTLHFFNAEGVPFFVQVIDGCALNGAYWVFGAGLGSQAVPLTVFDDRSGRSHRVVLPAYEPGGPVGAVLEPEALDICREGPTGGLPEATGLATYTSVTPECTDDVERIVLLSEGAEDGYRAMVRDGIERDRIIREGPVATVDDSRDWDELQLLAEGRTPRQVEGVLFSGAEGMLPGKGALDRALDDITKARVRRAFEAAKGWKVPQPLIRDLGLRDVECIFHVSLEFDSLGADAYLTQAGWIAEGGNPARPPELVEDRFAVELVTADGSTTALPLMGPLQGAPGDGTLWAYASDSAMVQLVDACDVSGSFWIVAAAVTEEPLELVVSDPVTGASASQVLWTDRETVSRLTDTVSLSACP